MRTVETTALLSEGALADWNRPEKTLRGRPFSSGLLRANSYARPSKLFTASRELMVAQVAVLNAEARAQIGDAVVTILRA